MPLTDTLKAVSDPVRREILSMLRKQSMNAGDIAAHFEISDPAISRHLAVLKKAGLVRSHRDGQKICYELNASVLYEIILWASALKGEEHERESSLEKRSLQKMADSQ